VTPEEILTKWLPNTGFPIALCFYLLAKVLPAVNALTIAVTELTATVKAQHATK